MANTQKSSPAAKMRKTNTKVGLNVTPRARNGGDGNSFVPADLIIDEGSETEEEDNTAMDNEFLNKMVDEDNRPVETVFGPGTEVWRSKGGTVYADVNEETKRELRDRAIWIEEAKAKATVGPAKAGSKRKVEHVTDSFDGDDDVIKKHRKAKAAKAKRAAKAKAKEKGKAEPKAKSNARRKTAVPKSGKTIEVSLRFTSAPLTPS